MSRRLLVLRALGLGDLLTAVPALRGLRAHHPAHRIVLATPRVLAPLAALSGAVDEVLDTPAFVLRPLPASRPDVAVNLHGRGPQSTARLRATRPGRLLAFDVPGGPAWDDAEHEVARWCRLVTANGIDADPTALRLPAPADPAPVPGASVVHPGASSGSRRWPAERFAAVARALPGPVVVTGGPDEVALAQQVATLAGLPDRAVLAGRTTLLQLAAQVAAARVVVCGDTGVAHLATAFGTPSVVLFGPVPPALWGPPDDPRHRALWAGGTGDAHGDETDEGLLTITAQEVLDAIDALDGRPVA